MVSIAADVTLLPLASESDAERTCRALLDLDAAEGRIVAVHVIEKAGGAPDKASVDQREERAEAIFERARERLADAGGTIETRILYGTDVAETIFDAAAEVDAGLVAFSPREASRLSRFLSGDTTLDLVTGTDRPVLVLPSAGDANDDLGHDDAGDAADTRDVADAGGTADDHDDADASDE